VPASREPSITQSAPGGERLGKVARISDAAVRNYRHVALLRHLHGLDQRSELRHADAGYDAGSADRARPDSDLDASAPGIDQSLGAVGGRHIARHHLHGIRLAL
jgi:hypothetical protein